MRGGATVCGKKEISNEDQTKLKEIFLPYANKRRIDFNKSNKLLAYYTTADTAYKIMQNKEIWMRNVTVMNDYKEVLYGINKINSLFLKNVYQEETILNKAGQRLYKVLQEFTDESGNVIIDDVLNQYFLEQTSWEYNAYISCFTEHDTDEDGLGRLSMWRAYGGDNGITIVFDPRKYAENLEEKYKIYLTPVAYLTDKELATEVEELAVNINKDFLHEVKQRDPQILHNWLMAVLRFAIVSIKHPGFKEEKEWRLVGHGYDLACETEVIRGVIQPVHKLEISNLREMLHHIIIGPTQYENVIFKEFEKILKEKYYMPRSDTLIVSSRIPYRK